MAQEARPAARPRRIGIFQPGRAGDFILTTGLFNAVRDAVPECQLTVITGPRSAEMARAHPAIDRTLVYDRSPAGLVRFFAALWAHRFDLWIDPKPHYSRSSAIIAALARARRKIGHNRGFLRPFDRDLERAGSAPVHFAEQALAPLTLAGLPRPAEPRISLGIPPAAAQWAEAQLPRPAPWSVLVNLSAGSRSRYWPVDHWADLLPLVAAERPTVFLLSSAPEDARLAAELIDRGTERGVTIRPLPRSGLLEIAALVRNVDLVLTVDTSLVHLAAAFDRPVVALYLRREPAFTMFRPRSSVNETVIADSESTMTGVPVEAVLAAYRRALGRLPAA